MNAKVLIVDDDLPFRRILRKVLTAEGYTVVDAATGPKALELLRRTSPDLVILDMALPGMSGLDACRAIRAFSDVAILVLSVRSLEREKIEALDAGADDYVTKPFSTPELLARMRAALRRMPLAAGADPTLRLGDLEIDFSTRRVAAPGREVHLTRKEFDLLQYMAANPDTPLPHRKLLQAIWGPDFGNESIYLRVFISQLRKKIEQDPRQPQYIVTEPCVGYRFRKPVS